MFSLALTFTPLSSPYYLFPVMGGLGLTMCSFSVLSNHVISLQGKLCQQQCIKQTLNVVEFCSGTEKLIFSIFLNSLSYLAQQRPP